MLDPSKYIGSNGSQFNNAKYVADFVHEKWPFISAEEVEAFYLGLQRFPVSQARVLVTLWILQKVLAHGVRVRLDNTNH